MKKIIITNKQSVIVGNTYEIVYKDGDGYHIKVMGTLIYIKSSDCEVVSYGKIKAKKKT